MDIKEAMSFIDSFSKSGKPVTDLSRAVDLMKRMGNPEKKLKFVHVAGTNGKGSTVEYISNALIFSGYKTGQFTSPFVLHYADRIRINGQEIDENSLCEIIEFVKNNISCTEYSQFEITMAIALLWFEREKCDIVVLECGIGGLLDCTNVIPPPLLAVITSISLDHTAILGDTVEKIAEQKSGIIKNGSAVILSMDNKDEVADIVRAKADSEKSTYIRPLFSDLRYERSKGMMNYFSYKGERFAVMMNGLHQPNNAATAIEACRFLRKNGFNVTEENITKSIAETQVKARCQYIDGKPPVLVDGGHNPAGIVALCSVLGKLRMEGKKLYTVMGMVNTKDYEKSVRSVAEYSDMMFTVDGFAPNAVSAKELAEISDARPCVSLDDAVKKAKQVAFENNGMAVICGSLYLASEYLNGYEK